MIVSIRISRKFLVPSLHEDVLSKPLSRANVWCSNNAAYKRFYCHSTINEQILTSAELKVQRQKLDKQKFEEFLSNPENEKRFLILELEVDVFRHNAERVPENIEPKDWLMLLDTPTKSRRKSVYYFLFFFFFMRKYF